MRKLFVLFFVAGTLALASCGEKKAAEETAATDSTAAPADTMVAPAPADTMAAPMDSAATDSVAK